MVRNNRPVFGIGPKHSIACFTDADSVGVKKVLCAASPTYGSLVRLLAATTNNGAPVHYQIFIGGTEPTSAKFATFDVAASAGDDGSVPTKNILDPDNIPSLIKDLEGNYYLPLGPGMILYIAELEPQAAGCSTAVHCIAEDLGE